MGEIRNAEFGLRNSEFGIVLSGNRTQPNLPLRGEGGSPCGMELTVSDRLRRQGLTDEVSVLRASGSINRNSTHVEIV